VPTNPDFTDFELLEANFRNPQKVNTEWLFSRLITKEGRVDVFGK